MEPAGAGRHFSAHTAVLRSSVPLYSFRQPVCLASDELYVRDHNRMEQYTLRASSSTNVILSPSSVRSELIHGEEKKGSWVHKLARGCGRSCLESLGPVSMRKR